MLSCSMLIFPQITLAIMIIGHYISCRSEMIDFSNSAFFKSMSASYLSSSILTKVRRLGVLKWGHKNLSTPLKPSFSTVLNGALSFTTMYTSEFFAIRAFSPLSETVGKKNTSKVIEIHIHRNIDMKK